jgi:hypothetical protein
MSTLAAAALHNFHMASPQLLRLGNPCHWHLGIKTHSILSYLSHIELALRCGRRRKQFVTLGSNLGRCWRCVLMQVLARG